MTSPRADRSALAARLLVSIVIGAAALYALALTELPPWPESSEAPVHVRYLLAAVALAPVVELLRALRLRHLVRVVRPIALRELVAITWTGQLAAFVLPLRIGELVRPGLYVRRCGMPFGTALALVGAERILDVLFLTGLALLSLPIGEPIWPPPDRVGELRLPVAAVPATIVTAFVVFALLIVALFGFQRAHRSGAAFTRRVLAPFAPRLGERIAAVIERLAAGAAVLADGPSAGKLALESLLLWVSNGVVLVLLAHAVGLESFDLPRSLVLLCTIAIGSMLPAGPAVLGAFQAAAYAALAVFLAPEQVTGVGPRYVFALYAFTVASVTVHGVVGLVLAPAIRRAALGSLGSRSPGDDGRFA